ncbi:MAG: heat-inducible transcriptional repressor HrcA [Microthrixaceae bacterium]
MVDDPTSPDRPADRSLDDRKAAILRAVVKAYIETAQPVGSANVVEGGALGVSPATVRSEMTVLEREGYLTQPHTSAGRIPTQRGYRFFVDQLGPGELDAAQRRQVRGFFSHAHGELEEMLRSTTRMLARLTSTTAVVVGDVADAAVVRSVQLVGLSARTCLLVVVLSSGTVLKRSIERADPIDDDVLASAAALLTAGLRDKRPSKALAVGLSGDPLVDSIVADALDAIAHTVAESGHLVHIEGASNMAEAFDAASTLHAVLGLLEQQMAVVSLIEDVLDRGLTVAIGSETGLAPLSECSLVVAPYRVDGERAGTIGVLGPTRMNYEETLAAVAVVSNRLSRLLSEGERS